MPSRTATIPLLAGSAAALALSLAVAIAAPAVGAGGGELAAVQLRRGAVRELAAGKLLVAARNLPDPNFAATVVLLASHSQEGAMGLIVNKPTTVSIGRIFPDLDPAAGAGVTAFFGGPVSTSGVLALLRSAAARPDSRHVAGDLYLVDTAALLKQTMAAGAGPDRFRVYIGYAGWGAGQLEHETAEGSWYVLGGGSEVVFDPDPASLWRRQIGRAEALSAEGIRGPAPGSVPAGGFRFRASVSSGEPRAPVAGDGLGSSN